MWSDSKFGLGELERRCEKYGDKNLLICEKNCFWPTWETMAKKYEMQGKYGAAHMACMHHCADESVTSGKVSRSYSKLMMPISANRMVLHPRCLNKTFVIVVRVQNHWLHMIATVKEDKMLRVCLWSNACVRYTGKFEISLARTLYRHKVQVVMLSAVFGLYYLPFGGLEENRSHWIRHHISFKPIKYSRKVRSRLNKLAVQPPGWLHIPVNQAGGREGGGNIWGTEWVHRRWRSWGCSR